MPFFIYCGYRQNPLPGRYLISIFKIRSGDREELGHCHVIGRTQSHGSVQCYDRNLIDGLPRFTGIHDQWNARSS